MAADNTPQGSPLVFVNDTGGITVIDPHTPLKRLNYFDGKFLRAADLELEQGYLRHLVALSNQGQGAGIVYGYDTALGQGDDLQIGPGLAIAPSGQVLLLQSSVTQNIQALIDATAKTAPNKAASDGGGAGTFGDCAPSVAPPPATVVPAGGVYLIVICAAEALCGQEDVYGIACQDACVSSTNHSHRLDGIVLRAIPLPLAAPPLVSKAVDIGSARYLRSQVAHRWFADEASEQPSAISRPGLLSGVWCLGADYGNGGCEVPLAVVARNGATTVFLDVWTVRRERIDAPAKRHWQWKMRMRPWDVFLAQILQFQCQLSGLFRRKPQPGGEGGDPCAETQALLQQVADAFSQLTDFYAAVTQGFTVHPLASDTAPPSITSGLVPLRELQKSLQIAGAARLIPSNQFLIDGGILELPSAGYLPVLPTSGASVNEQVRRLLGAGVDLRFCVVRPDFVAHALEEAQHMERISLLQGLDDPADKPKVDILVPNGELIDQRLASVGRGFEAQLDINSSLFPESGHTEVLAINQNIRFQGAARAEQLPAGGGAVYLAAEFEASAGVAQEYGGTSPLVWAAADAPSGNMADAAYSLNNPPPQNISISKPPIAFSRPPLVGTWASLACERNLFAARLGDTSNFNARAIVASTAAMNAPLLDIELNGLVEITEQAATTGTTQTLKGRISNAQLSLLIQPISGMASVPRQSIFVDFGVTATLVGGTAIDIVLVYLGSTQIKLSADWGKQPLEVKASIVASEQDATGQTISNKTFAAARLKENADVLSAGNASHQQALDGIDIVAAVLRDVNFAAAKARLLFPPPPPPTDEILVRATADWVLFHRRRDKQCGRAVEVPPSKAPERYRIFNITVVNMEEAGRIAETISGELRTPPRFARRLQVLADSAAEDLTIKFAGDSASPLFDFQAADAQWRRLKPGQDIAFVFYGSQNDPNVALQTNRLRQFESAISNDSREPSDNAATLHPLVPFPAQATPPDADGIMLLITVAEQIHVYGVSDVLLKNIDYAIRNPGGGPDFPALLAASHPPERYDFGTARHTVKPDGTVAVADVDVITTFSSQHPANGKLATGQMSALLVSRRGDPADWVNKRNEAAQQIVTDLANASAHSPPAPLSVVLVYPDIWPFADTQSVLLVDVYINVDTHYVTVPK